MSDPVQINPIATFFDGLIKAALSGGDTAVEAYITALDPELLAFPPVAFLIDQGVEYLTGYIYQAIAKVTTAAVIDVETNGEQSAAITAATELNFAEASGDPVAIQKAVQDATMAYNALVHWDGVANT